MKVYIQSQMISVKSRHLLLFYKIAIPIYACLPELQKLKYVSVVKVRSCSLQPATHGFLDCFVSLVGVTFQVIFQEPEQMIVCVDQIRTLGSVGEQLPSHFMFLCTRKQAGKPTGTNFPISKNIHYLLERMVPHSKLHCDFSVILRSCRMTSSTFCLLSSVAAVLD